MDDTEQRRERARELRGQGQTLKQIHEETGLSISYISRLVGTTASKPRVGQQQREAAKADAARGLTLDEIAAKYGRSKSAISRWITSVTEKGDVTGSEARRAAKAAEIKVLWRQGLNVAEISRQASASPETVRETVQGIHGGPGLQVERDILASMARYQGGEPIDSIAASLHRSVATVSQWLKDNGVRVLSSMERRTSEEQHQYAVLGAAAIKAKAELTASYRVCAREGCGKEFRLRSARDRTMYHSRECAGLARTDPDKRITVTCPCGEVFESWAASNRVYHSRECWAKYAPNAERVVIEGNQFDSPWEGLFYGLCRVANVGVKRHDREDIVEWLPGRKYAPDFDMTVNGKRVCVEVKGRKRVCDDQKWAAWREQRCPLVILLKDDLYSLSPAGLRKALSQGL